MNHLNPEILAELNRQRIQEDMAGIRLQGEALKDRPSLLGRGLFALGGWMVKMGEKLRNRHSIPQLGSVGLVKRSV